MGRLPNHPPRAAYVHVPFCRHRCGYCNFTLIAGRDDLIDRYLLAIETELATLPERYPLDTLFLGGGTPSHLSISQLERLIAAIRKHFDFTNDYEFSVEVNPLDFTLEKARAMQALGVTRISLGVQSFQNAKLKFLERDHTLSDVTRAIDIALAHFPQVSLDLIFATPEETRTQWEFDLQLACESQVQHISTYGLTIEAGSAFYSQKNRGKLHPLENEQEAILYEVGIDYLIAHGYEHYEVSNFAKANSRCRHNEIYWRGESYFAFGPGAARYVDGTRSMNHRSTLTYLQRVLQGESPTQESETLTAVDRARERFVFGMRMLQGINISTFEMETGFTIFELMAEPVAWCLQQKYMEQDNHYLRLTRAGLLVSDSLWPKFLTC